MTKQQFIETAKNEGVQTAALYCAMVRIPLAVVQLWLKAVV